MIAYKILWKDANGELHDVRDTASIDFADKFCKEHNALAKAEGKKDGWHYKRIYWE